MQNTICSQVGGLLRRLGDALEKRVRFWTSPCGLALGAATDLFRSRRQLLAENALLRQQLIVARRGLSRPQLTTWDRVRIVLLARLSDGWRGALLLVQPDTVLRWHRMGFRLFWRIKSRRRQCKPKLTAETVSLIKEMAAANRLWGAERIRGELLKLGIKVSKRTVQKYMNGSRGPGRSGQSWSTFLRNHANDRWACDFLQVYDGLFKPIFAFFIIELGTRRVVHVGVTRSPTPGNGRHSSFARPRHGSMGRDSCCATTMASSGRSLMLSPAPVGRGLCGPPSGCPKRTESVSVFSEACAGSASTTSSSCPPGT
jgi:hypothetical protein